MKKNDKRREKLSILLMSAGVFLVNTAPSISAMEKTKKIVTMKDFENPNLSLSETVPEIDPGDRLNWSEVDPKTLMTQDELQSFMDKHKMDIIYGMTKGNKSRNKAYEEGVKIVKAANTIFDEIVRFKNNKRKKQGKPLLDVKREVPSNDKIDELRKKWTNEKKNKNTNEKNKTTKSTIDDHLIRYLSINPEKTAEENWNNIGRGILHQGILPEDYITNGPVKSELEDMQKGSVNCTGWSKLIAWFLTKNGMPAKEMGTETHTQTLTLITDKSRKAIIIASIDVANEEIPDLRGITFIIRPLTFLPQGQDDPGYDYNEIPIALPYHKQTTLLGEYLKYTLISASPQIRSGYLKSLQKEFQRLESNGEIKEKKYQRRYQMKTLPRTGEGILLPINIEMLDTPLDGPGWWFTVKGSRNKKTQMTLIKFRLTKDEYEEYKNWDAKVTTMDGYKPELTLINPANNWERDHEYFVCGLPENPKECVGFWVVPRDNKPIVD